MGKADDSKLKKRSQPQVKDTGTPSDDDAEGHLFLPNDPATARALAGDRAREIDRRVRDRSLERDASQFKQRRPNR
jgi:hypothetical protein